MAATTQEVQKAIVFSKAGNSANKMQPTPDYLLSEQALLARANGLEVKGRASAQFLLGMGYMNGHFGMKVNYIEGTKWLEKALEGTKWLEERSHSDPIIRDCVEGFCQENGYVGREKKKGEEALAAGGRYITPAKQYIPAKFLSAAFDYTHKDILRGMLSSAEQEEMISDTKKDIEECVAAGFVPAITFLGKRCMLGWEGWGKEVDYKRGLQLLQEACDKGDAPAKIYLGGIYEDAAHGVSKDLNKAKSLYESALEQNDPSAGFFLEGLAKKIASNNTAKTLVNPPKKAKPHCTIL